MTTYFASPSDVQLKVNALLPGDILILNSASTYPAFTVGVSGTATQPITIYGVRGTTGTLPAIQTGVVTITGQYLNIAKLWRQGGSVGIDVVGARHVAIERCEVRQTSGAGYRIRGGSKYIYIRNCATTGSIETTGQGSNPGYQVGTAPAGSTIDETAYVYFMRCEAFAPGGHGFHFHQGAHHIVARHVNYDYGSDGRGKIGFLSYASYVQFEVASAYVGRGKYAFQCMRTVVNGIEYGHHQEVAFGNGRLDGNLPPPAGETIAMYGSNAPDFRVYSSTRQNASSPFKTADEIDGVPWVSTGMLYPMELFEPMEFGTPAADYAFDYPQGPGEFGIFKGYIGSQATTLNQFNTPQPSPITIGQMFYHVETERPMGVVRVGYWRQTDLIGVPTQCAIYDVLTEEVYSGSVTTVPTPPAGFGWHHIDIEADVVLEPFRWYLVAFLCPQGKNSLLDAGDAGRVLGTFSFGEYWSWTYGWRGVVNGPIVCDRLRGGISGGALPDASGLGYEWNAADMANVNPGRFSPRVGNKLSYPTGRIFDDITTDTIVADINLMLDVVIKGWREPATFTANPGDNLQALLDSLIPGDVLIISGVHVGQFVMRVKGWASRKITIRGDGTAILRAPWGKGYVERCLRVTGRYVLVENLIVEQAGIGVLVEETDNVKLRGITVRDTRGAGIVARGCSYIYHESCVVYSTGGDLNTGDAFRCGSTPSSWPGTRLITKTEQSGIIATRPAAGQTGTRDDRDIPDETSFIRYDNCAASRCLGDGFDISAAAHDVVVKGCAVDHTVDNIPEEGQPAGTAGFHSRGNRVQFINDMVTGAPGYGFEPFDVIWDQVTYGRAQQVKGGQSINQGKAGVGSQSDDLKVYSDFVSTAPRLAVIEGGWSGSVSPATFTELNWSSPAAGY